MSAIGFPFASSRSRSWGVVWGFSKRSSVSPAWLSTWSVVYASPFGAALITIFDAPGPTALTRPPPPTATPPVLSGPITGTFESTGTSGSGLTGSAAGSSSPPPLPLAVATTSRQGRRATSRRADRMQLRPGEHRKTLQLPLFDGQRAFHAGLAVARHGAVIGVLAGFEVRDGRGVLAFGDHVGLGDLLAFGVFDVDVMADRLRVAEVQRHVLAGFGGHRVFAEGEAAFGRFDVNFGSATTAPAGRGAVAGFAT